MWLERCKLSLSLSLHKAVIACLFPMINLLSLVTTSSDCCWQEFRDLPIDRLGAYRWFRAMFWLFHSLRVARCGAHVSEYIYLFGHVIGRATLPPASTSWSLCFFYMLSRYSVCILVAPSGWTRVVILLLFLSKDAYRDLFTTDAGQHTYKRQLSARNINLRSMPCCSQLWEEEEENSSMCTWVIKDIIDVS